LLDEDAQQEEEEPRPFYSKLADITEQPLTLLSKILLGVCLFLLLFASIFVGLFSGAQHKLNKPSPPVQTTLVTLSYTFTDTLTETSVSATITTTTTTATSTYALPAPTHDPKTVSQPLLLSRRNNLVQQEPCTSTQCIVLAASILSSLDTSFDPCEDFYLFTSKWHSARLALDCYNTYVQTMDGSNPILSHPTRAHTVTLKMSNFITRFAYP
jgi:endothelin-converting enzyme